MVTRLVGPKEMKQQKLPCELSASCFGRLVCTHREATAALQECLCMSWPPFFGSAFDPKPNAVLGEIVELPHIRVWVPFLQRGLVGVFPGDAGPEDRGEPAVLIDAPTPHDLKVPRLLVVFPSNV